MLDLIRALVALRVAFMVIVVGAALTVLAVWSLSRGAAGIGVAVLAAVLVCVGLAAAALRRGSRQH